MWMFIPNVVSKDSPWNSIDFCPYLINDQGMNKPTKSFAKYACQFCGSDRELVETLIDDEFFWDESSGMYQPNGFTDIFEHTGNQRCAQCEEKWSGL